MTARQFTFTVLSSAGPSWYQNVVPRQWTKIAAGASSGLAAWQSGAVIDSLPAPVFGNSSAFANPGTAYGGGCVDQSRKRFLFGSGGHTKWDNGLYELDLLDDAAPKWVVLQDRSNPAYPASYAAYLGQSSAAVAAALPGIGEHGLVEHDGTVPQQLAVGSGPAAHHSNYLVAWDSATSSYWRLHVNGDPSSGPYDGKILNDADTGTNNWWACYRYDITSRRWWRVANDSRYTNGASSTLWRGAGIAYNVYQDHVLGFPESGGTIFRADRVNGGWVNVTTGLANGNIYGGTSRKWCVVPTAWDSNSMAADTHRALMCYGNGYRFWLMDANNYATRRDVTPPITDLFPTGSAANTMYRPGLVYHPRSNGFLLFGDVWYAADQQSNPELESLYLLYCDSEDWWTGNWTWKKIQPSNINDPARAVPASNSVNGTYGRFNIVYGMGGTDDDLLVYTYGSGEPVFAMRLAEDLRNA